MKQVRLRAASWFIDESRQLGASGGFGSVYIGQSAAGVAVAVKQLRNDIGDAAHRELAFAEAFIGKTPSNVVPILDFGIDNASQRACIVMALADGSLREHIRTHRIHEREAVIILTQIVAGLLNVSEWVHRDLKPENVLRLSKNWCLADFGIARLADADTSLRTLKGALSPLYAAPEQWNHGHATHATDVYSLGCIGVELLSGRPPFLGSIDEVAERHRNELPNLEHGSFPLRTLLHGMLAKSPEARPSLNRVASALNSMLRREGSPEIGQSVLSEAGARAAREAAIAEVSSELRKAASETKAQLEAHALSSLRGIYARLLSQVRAEVPAIRIDENPSRCHIALSNAELYATIGKYRSIADDKFFESGWKVICGDVIAVVGLAGTRSASLWFASESDLQYCWIEVAYRSTERSSEAGRSLPPGIDADFAAAISTHEWHIAHKYRIDSGDEIDAFVDRWTTAFANAADIR